MKKIHKNILIAFALFLWTARSQATIHIIMVSDFLFTPNNLTVEVGDTVEWMWGNGTHTTTSTSVPLGAVGWDQPITNTSPVFDYVVPAPGAYQYQCTPHSSMGMVGQFTANNPTGIIGQVVHPYVSIDQNLTADQIRLKYNFPEKQNNIALNIYNIIGGQARSVYIGTIPAGESEKIISLSGISKGAYLVRLEGKDISLTRKIVIQ